MRARVCVCVFIQQIFLVYFIQGDKYLTFIFLLIFSGWQARCRNCG